MGAAGAGSPRGKSVARQRPLVEASVHMPTGPVPPTPQPADVERLRGLLSLDRYPRSAAYDPVWVMRNEMGPNALWLAEALGAAMPLTPGDRILDLGCGNAMTSIFLAREFGVQVWAVDLWASASENWTRVQEAGFEGRVHPVKPSPADVAYPLASSSIG